MIGMVKNVNPLEIVERKRDFSEENDEKYSRRGTWCSQVEQTIMEGLGDILGSERAAKLGCYLAIPYLKSDRQIVSQIVRHESEFLIQDDDEDSFSAKKRGLCSGFSIIVFVCS